MDRVQGFDIAADKRLKLDRTGASLEFGQCFLLELPVRTKFGNAKHWRETIIEVALVGRPGSLNRVAMNGKRVELRVISKCFCDPIVERILELPRPRSFDAELPGTI